MTTSTRHHDEPSAQAPADLPVLAELPELASVLDDLVEADRRQVAAVIALARQVDTDQVAQASGVGVEHWLGVAARATRLDRRLLLRLARLLARLPLLCGTTADGAVSFAQLRGLAIALRGLPAALDSRIDAWLTDAARELAQLRADPDALIEQARSAMVELTDQLDQQEGEAPLRRHLVLQPRLDGTGGRFSGEEDAYGFAILDAATAPRRDQLADAARGRADNLQAWLHHTCGDRDGGHDDTDGEGDRNDTDPDGDRDDPLERDDPLDQVGPAGLPASARAHVAAGRRLVAPRLLVRIELDTLLGAHPPVEVLTHLVGGRLRLTATAARRVIDHAGAQVRAIVVDEGQVVGVGRATRVPPDWLTDTVHAVHDRCTGPLCDRPALGADIDHARPWVPAGDEPAGTTDHDNLGPLCDTTNRGRRATGWTPRQTRRGVRTWHHPRTGLTVTSIPSTWRPSNQRPASNRHGTDPPGTDPPGTDPPRTDDGRPH